MKLNKDSVIGFIQKSKSFIVNRWKILVLVAVSYIAGIVSFFAILLYAASTDPVVEYVDKELLDEAYVEIDNLEGEVSDLETQVETLQAKVDEAAPWFKMTDEEKKKTEAEAKAAEEKRLAEEQAKKEAEEKAKEEAEAKAKAEAEAKEKQGYNTGITYDQLARTPDNYLAEKVKFRGKVLQVMEGDDYISIRLAVNGDYDNVIYGQYEPSIVSSRVLEDDNITIYGLSSGLFTYESTMGAQISIPGVIIDKIDQ